MARESLSPAAHKARELDELKTIQLLEETIGPKSLRQLRHTWDEEEARRILDEVARTSATDLHEIDDVVHEWTRAVGEPVPRPITHEEHLDRSEILSSIVELKESEAQMMRRAAASAPDDGIRSRLLTLAARQESMAEKLRSIM